MYSVVEAELKDGKVIPVDSNALPDAGHVLIVVLSGEHRPARWQECRGLLGWLKTDTDAAEWEREIRGEWGHRP